ncbi:hypothetical protein [Actinoplanes flavus]|uniref:Bacteriocin biosynthesis cyclodehydratase domain-containing protein n=1 Tax=Actinoplanes flavus TaxID=2820290 RepID=A0ABS3UD08_9ACTN|nr:hypothetical protein [Actinoplanes flavus]MBO3736664.1 hypothetical protein [Actinoplanes flavus]
MRGLNTATVIDLLNRLRADRNPELTVTAAGRSAGITAAVAATAAIATAIADVTDIICPPGAEPGPARIDGRWNDVRHACDHAAQHTARLAHQLTPLAAGALLVVTDMEPVHYQGSITARHGAHVLAGPCDCRRCGHRGGRLRLSLLLEDLDDLLCVRPRSVTAFPDEPHDLPIGDLGTALHEAIHALPPVLATGHAISLIQNLMLFTGRTRTVVTSWATAIDQRLHGRFITSLDGTNPASRRDHLTSRLEQADTAFGGVQTELRRAVGTLRAIAADPPRPAASH